jgi:multiple sugar transport system substrate-binding protein
MTTTSPRGVLIRVLAPVAVIGLVASCAGGGTGGGGGGSAPEAAGLSAVTPEQLQGTTISVSRPFGECATETAGVTDVTQATDECETFEILTNAFNAENGKGITVERLGGGESDTYYDTLNAAYAGGNPPDVALVHASRITDYARRNLLLPLDQELAATGTEIEDAVAVAREGATFEDRLYALPFDVHGGLVHLNVDLFRQAGLVDPQGAPVLPTSPEEFLAHAQQMKDRTGVNYFGTGRVNEGFGVHMWRSLVQQQGGDVLNADRTAATVDSPEARTALDFMGRVFDGGFADPAQTYDAAEAAFLSGTTAMLLNGTWVVDQYSEDAQFEYRVSDFPTLYGEPAMWADTHTWALPRKREADPVRYRAALEYANYLYANSQDWAVNTGHLAARTSVLESPEYQQAPQRANYVRTGTEVARQVPKIDDWPAVQDALVANIDSIWFQGRSVDEALAEADRQINSILAQG